MLIRVVVVNLEARLLAERGESFAVGEAFQLLGSRRRRPPVVAVGRNHLRAQKDHRANSVLSEDWCKTGVALPAIVEGDDHGARRNVAQVTSANGIDQSVQWDECGSAAPESVDMVGKSVGVRIVICQNGDAAARRAQCEIDGSALCDYSAGAVVAKDVPPNKIVGGIPAKVIGERPDDLSYELGSAGAYFWFV